MAVTYPAVRFKRFSAPLLEDGCMKSSSGIVIEKPVVLLFPQTGEYCQQ